MAAAAAAPGRVPAQAAAAAAAPALATSAGGPQAVGESTSANGSTPGGESSGSGSGSGPVASSCLRMKCLSTAPVAAGSKPSAPAASAPGAAPAPAPATAPAAAAAVTQAAPPAAPRTAAAASTSAPMKPAPVGAGAAAPAAGPGPAPRRLGAAAAGAGGVGAGRPGALPPAPRPAANPFVPVLDAVEVLLAVAEALKGLHRKGIPHGHITPSVVQLQLAPAPAPPPSASAASQQGQGHATQQERSAGNTSAVSTKSSKALATVDTVMAGFLTPEDRPASQQAARGPSTSTAGDAGEPYDGTCLGQGGEGSGSTLGGMGLLGVHRELGSVGSTMGSTGFSVGPFRPFGGVPGADLLGPGGLPTVPEGSGTATSTSPSAQLNTDNTHTSLSKSASAANMPALAAGATSVSLGPKRPTAGPSTSAQPGSLSAAAFTPSLNPDSTAAPPPHSSSSTDIAPARPATSSAPVTTILPSAFSTAASIPLLSTAAPASAPTSRQPPSSAFATAAQALRLRAILPLPALCPAMLQMLTWGRARPVGLPQEQLLWAAPELLNTGLGPSIHWGWAAPHLLANKGSGGGMGGGSLGAEHVGVRNGRRAAAAWGGRPDHGGTHTARPEREWSRDREGGREGGHHGGMGGSLGASRRYRSQGAPLLLMGKVGGGGRRVFALSWFVGRELVGREGRGAWVLDARRVADCGTRPSRPSTIQQRHGFGWTRLLCVAVEVCGALRWPAPHCHRLVALCLTALPPPCRPGLVWPQDPHSASNACGITPACDGEPPVLRTLCFRHQLVLITFAVDNASNTCGSEFRCLARCTGARGAWTLARACQRRTP